jgi:hypothetical protein
MLLAGVLLTLAGLGHMDWVTIAGCRPAASDACRTLAEGYPLRWLTSPSSPAPPGFGVLGFPVATVRPRNHASLKVALIPGLGRADHYWRISAR